MKSPITISIDYSKTCAQANRLKTTAEECERIEIQLKNSIASLLQYWEGEAANAFLAAIQQWRKELQSIQSELTSISTTIKKVADAIREADRRASEAAKFL